MGARLGTPGAASIGFHINAAKMGVDSVRYGQLVEICCAGGSGGGEVVRATASQSRGPEFKSTWR